MKRLADFFYIKFKLWHALTLTGLMVCYAALIMGGQSECLKPYLNGEMQILGLKFAYNYDYAMSFFSSLGVAGLECYRNLILIGDNIFPLLYGSMYIAWISILYKKVKFKSPVLKLINLFPLLHMLTDWAENSFELNLINTFMQNSDLDPTEVLMTSVVSSVKWVLSSINYGIILLGIILMILSNKREKTKKA